MKQGFERVYRMDNVKKNFGFGCMRLPMNGEQVDFEETKRMVELLTTAAKLPDPMQAMALGYARGLADAAQLHEDEPDKPEKSA